VYSFIGFPRSSHPELAENRELFQLIKEMSPLEAETYADPTELLKLPFPFRGVLPRDRFAISKQTFDYMGRERFTELWANVVKLLEGEWDKIYLYGTLGYGKSHMLAALACLLTKRGERVVYLPDCRAMLGDFLQYIKVALSLTFADSVEEHEQIVQLRTEEEIVEFLGRYRPKKFFFIIDQVNALEPNPIMGQDTITNGTKDHVTRWLDRFCFWHRRIQSASANYGTFKHMKLKQTGDIKMAVHGGYSAVSNLDYGLPRFNNADSGSEGDPGMVEKAQRL
jgi:hypothetical protein